MAFSAVTAENTAALMGKATFPKACAEALGTCLLYWQGGLCFRRIAGIFNLHVKRHSGIKGQRVTSGTKLQSLIIPVSIVLVTGAGFNNFTLVFLLPTSTALTWKGRGLQPSF